MPDITFRPDYFKLTVGVNEAAVCHFKAGISFKVFQLDSVLRPVDLDFGPEDTLFNIFRLNHHVAPQMIFRSEDNFFTAFSA